MYIVAIVRKLYHLSNKKYITISANYITSWGAFSSFKYSIWNKITRVIFVWHKMICLQPIQRIKNVNMLLSTCCQHLVVYYGGCVWLVISMSTPSVVLRYSRVIYFLTKDASSSNAFRAVKQENISILYIYVPSNLIIYNIHIQCLVLALSMQL